MGSRAHAQKVEHEKEIQKLIKAARRREREHLRTVRYDIKHHSYIEAAKNLAWAAEQHAFAEGLERALYG